MSGEDYGRQLLFHKTKTCREESFSIPEQFAACLLNFNKLLSEGAWSHSGFALEQVRKIMRIDISKLITNITYGQMCVEQHQFSGFYLFGDDIVIDGSSDFSFKQAIYLLIGNAHL